MTGPVLSIVPLGKCAWTLVLGDKVSRPLHQRVTELASRISAAQLPGLVEIVPAYATVTVFFEGNAGEMRARLDALWHAEPDPDPHEVRQAAAQLLTERRQRHVVPPRQAVLAGIDTAQSSAPPPV